MDIHADHWDVVEAFAAERGMTGAPPEEVFRVYVEHVLEEELARRDPDRRRRMEEEQRLQRMHAEVWNYTGTKYDPDLDIAEVARRVRGEIKQRFPHLKASVRIARYAGGQSLTVNVLPNATDEEMDDIVEIVESYNFDRSGYNDDYVHNNFFQTIKRDGVEGFWGRRGRQSQEIWRRTVGNGGRVPQEPNGRRWQEEGF